MDRQPADDLEHMHGVADHDQQHRVDHDARSDQHLFVRQLRLQHEDKHADQQRAGHSPSATPPVLDDAAGTPHPANNAPASVSGASQRDMELICDICSSWAASSTLPTVVVREEAYVETTKVPGVSCVIIIPI